MVRVVTTAATHGCGQQLTPSCRRGSSVKYETIPKINASLLFGV